MEAYSAVPQVLQRQAAYGGSEKEYFMPGMQQSLESIAPQLNSQLNATKVTIASEYHMDNIINLTGLNSSAGVSGVTSVNQTSYIVKNLDNTSKVIVDISTPVCSYSTFNMTHLSGNNPRKQMQSSGLNMQGINDGGTTATTGQGTFGDPNQAADPQPGGIIKIPEPIQVSSSEVVKEKVGSLNIKISESFLPWNISNKTILDLEFMRHLFNIMSVDIIFPTKNIHENGIYTSVKQLLYNKLLSDWLVLKCEEKQIPFFKVNSQVEIYSVNNFTTLLNAISQESCLPLPFITEEKNLIKYLYLNFPKSSNDRVKKLNMPIFHIADNGRKRLPCKYPGIRLDCNFERSMHSFTIHVHQSALRAYEASVSYIRQHIIYNHIVWGFLQAWIRRVKEHYNQCFKLEDIAKNLSLCQAEAPVGVKGPGNDGSDKGLTYFIDYSNFYLKFDPVTLKETKTSFSIVNFATNTVCSVSIIQYYRQFFLINDMHYSDALKNLIMFFRNGSGGSVANVKDLVYLLPRHNPLPSFANYEFVHEAEHGTYPSNTSTNVGCADLPASTSSNTEKVAPWVNFGANPNNTAYQGKLDQASVTTMPTKPLLKTRTVEEINSSVDANKCLNNPSPPDTSRMTHSKLGGASHQLNPISFCALIRKILDNCYATNISEFSKDDESQEVKMIEQRFDEAVNKAVGMITLEAFIETIYNYLQLYYSNSTCQYVLNKNIWKALEIKYPNLKGFHFRNAEEYAAKEYLQSYVTRNRNAPATDTESNLYMSADYLQYRIPTNSLSLQNCQPKRRASKSYINSCPSRVSQVNTVPGGVGNVNPGKAYTYGKSTNKTNALPRTSGSGEPNETDLFSSTSATEETFPRKCGKRYYKKIQSKTLDDYLVPYVNTVTSVPVPDSRAGMCKTWRLNSETKNKSTVTRNKGTIKGSNEVHSVIKIPEEKEKAVQTDSGDEPVPTKSNYSRFNLKPCSVLLNSNDVKTYMEKCRKRKRSDASLDECDSGSDVDFQPRRMRRRRICSDDSEDFNFVRETRQSRRKAVSEMQYMEARTSVLQRLRKRKAVYAGYEKSRGISEEELDRFFIRQNSSPRVTRYVEDDEEDLLGSDESHCSENQKEKSPVLKDLRLVLVRLEDTPEYELYRNQLLRKGDSNAKLDSLNDGNIPRTKRKYFEMREGKLYLKEGYHVQNGVIVRIDKETDPVRPKVEPDSFEVDTEFCDYFVKRERIVD